MSGEKKKHICPVERSGTLDNRFRRWIQNPQKIVGPYIKEGMTALDIGCGPGYFSIDMAKMVGKTGRVIAADLQDGMLHKIRDKINGTELGNRMTLHKCEDDKVGVTEKVDFILLCYMVHEVPDKLALFKEIETLLNSNGQVLIIEPPFHVSKKAFEETVRIAKDAGLSSFDGPKLFLNKTVILKKG